jgi:hypothetical protein
MMRKSVLFILICLAAFKLSAQDIGYAREVIKTLASPELKGRGYVEGGHLKAAKYIREQFREIGLKSFEQDYFQPFSLKINTFPSRMSLILNDNKLIPGKDFIVDAASSSANGEYEVVVVKKQDLLDDGKVRQAVQSSAGKMLIIDERDFKTENKDDIQKANDVIKTLKSDPGLQHAGVILFTSGKLTIGYSTVQSPRPALIVSKACDLSEIKKVKLQVDAKLIECKTQNVAGYLEGEERPDSFIVVVAHYDHMGKMGEEVYFPGANDNASGVAMILNLAKHYKLNPHRYSLAFIALGAEEAGILGAKHYVENALFDLDRIAFLVNFDMAGTGDEGIKVVNGSVFQDRFDLLTEINAEKGYLKSVQIRGAACNSDHCMFYQKGVKCFFIYTLGGIQAYHDIYDRYETLPLTEFEDYFRLMTDFFAEIP